MIATRSGQKTILFLDDHVPYPGLGVGYPRARRLLLNLSDMGHAVTFIPLEFPDDDEQSARRVLTSRVELILGMQPAKFPLFLRSRIEEFDLIFVSRPDNMRHLLAALRELPADLTSVPILYDAEAIFAAREIRRHTVEGKPLSMREQETMLNEEMTLARAASHVGTVSERDAETFRAAGCPSVSVLGDGFDLKPATRRFSERPDLLFVGALDDDPSPNVDALTWFVENVLPRVRAGASQPVRLVIAGRCGARRVQAVSSAGVALLGQVADLEPLHNAARVFIAPHRYAAGIPNKVLEASAYGVPSVISELLAGQLGWCNGVEVLAASTAEQFADAVLRLYSDENLWLSVRNRVLGAVEQKFSLAMFRRSTAEAIESTLLAGRPCLQL